MKNKVNVNNYTDKPELHVCPDCYGGGQVLMNEYDDPETNLAVGVFDWCNYCEGTGRVTEDKLPPNKSDKPFTGIELPDNVMKILNDM